MKRMEREKYYKLLSKKLKKSPSGIQIEVTMAIFPFNKKAREELKKKGILKRFIIK